MKLPPIAARKSACAIGTCSNRNIGPRPALLGRSSGPPSERVALDGRFPGLKAWLDFRSPPAGHKTRPQPRIVAYSPLFGAKSHPKPYLAPFGSVPHLSALTGSVPNHGGWGRSVANFRPQRGLSPIAVSVAHRSPKPNYGSVGLFRSFPGSVPNVSIPNSQPLGVYPHFQCLGAEAGVASIWGPRQGSRLYITLVSTGLVVLSADEELRPICALRCKDLCPELTDSLQR